MPIPADTACCRSHLLAWNNGTQSLMPYSIWSDYTWEFLHEKKSQKSDQKFDYLYERNLCKEFELNESGVTSTV